MLRLTKTIHNHSILLLLSVHYSFYVAVQVTQQRSFTAGFIISCWLTVNALRTYDHQEQQQQPTGRHGDLLCTRIITGNQYIGTYQSQLTEQWGLTI